MCVSGVERKAHFHQALPSRFDIAKLASFLFVLIRQCPGACSGVVYSLRVALFRWLASDCVTIYEVERIHPAHPKRENRRKACPGGVVIVASVARACEGCEGSPMLLHCSVHFFHAFPLLKFSGHFPACIFLPSPSVWHL